MRSGDGSRPGKRVGGSVYLHRSALLLLTASEREAVQKAASAAGWDGWNVARLDGGPTGRVALLEYESFDAVAFPALLGSCLVELNGSATRRNYRSSANPPILHRKELLLAPDHPQRPLFAGLTAELEAKGLFADPIRIGTRRAWEKRLTDAGVRIDGHSVTPLERVHTPHIVARHKTAIARQRLSVPMQELVRAGLVIEGRTVFDYGCGRGDDIAALAGAGINAIGWDPHWRPHAERIPSDVVNLGFVLNVIENPTERADTARKAFALAKICMGVGVMLVGKGNTAGLQRLGDGYLSTRGTFQKYFTQAEIKSLLEASLGAEAIAVAPGVFLVFRNKIEEQRFLARRHRQARDVAALIRAVPPPGLRPPKATPGAPRPPRETVAEQNRETLAALWAVALDLGRMPADEELPPELAAKITEAIGSPKKAFGLAERLFGRERLDEARDARIRDLSVYFALKAFNRRQSYGELPPELQRDVRIFFGSLKDAESAGRDLLFSLGRSETIEAACRQAATSGLGYLVESHSLLIDGRLVDRLPAPLRAYIGCAEKLYGSVANADALKIHIASGKLTILKYEDYVDSQLPRLTERIKIKMKEQDWDEFRYDEGENSRVLTLKSLIMSPDLPAYSEQKAFDDHLISAIPTLSAPIDLPAADIAKALRLTHSKSAVCNRAGSVKPFPP